MLWTPERIADLTRLWNEGLTTSQIGMKLGISKNAVVGKAHRLHLSSRPSPIKATGRPRMPRPVARAVPTAIAPPPAIITRPVPPPAPAHAPSAASGRVLELSNRSCKWPIGHPGDTDFHFCGERALSGKPYCATHAAMAYVKVKSKTGEAA